MRKCVPRYTTAHPSETNWLALLAGASIGSRVLDMQDGSDDEQDEQDVVLDNSQGGLDIAIDDL